MAVNLLFNTKNFNKLKMFKGKVIFFIATIIATEGERLHFNNKVSKTISYRVQNQINMKTSFFSLPFKFYIKKKTPKYITRTGQKIKCDKKSKFAKLEERRMW